MGRQGTEFYNRQMDRYCKDNNVYRYSTSAVDRKPAIVERFNRTMKEIMWKYFAEKHTNVWYNILDDIVNLYNNRFHHTLGMTPADARETKNADAVADEMSAKSDFYSRNLSKKPNLHIGDRVRKILNKELFQKGYKPKWSADVYTIINMRYDGAWYFIIDDSAQNWFYDRELIKVNQG